MSRKIAASFWRGGTSRGLLLNSTALPYKLSTINSIISTALGSPDSFGRQIDGLGGGVSSLSKVSIIGSPSELKGIPEKARNCDVHWLFGQVGVKDSSIDWTATCGNMLSAVATASISHSIINYSTLFTRSKLLSIPKKNLPLLFPISIYSASNDQIMHAKVPLDPITLQLWEPKVGEGVFIAGVPGEGAGIELSIPIEGEGVIQAIDTVEIDGIQIPISIISAGLPNIFVDPRSLNGLPSFSLPSNVLGQSNSSLTSIPNFTTTLERIRLAAASKFNIPQSLASPKITLISNPFEFKASDGTIIPAASSNIQVRATSSGDMHASIPGTTLAAVNLAAGIPGNLIHDIIHNGKNTTPSATEKLEKVVEVNVGNIAGVSNSKASFSRADLKAEWKCDGVIMMRTSREIMTGHVLIPERVFDQEI